MFSPPTGASQSRRTQVVVSLSSIEAVLAVPADEPLDECVPLSKAALTAPMLSPSGGNSMLSRDHVADIDE